VQGKNTNKPAKKKLAIIAPSVGQTYCSIISFVDGIPDAYADTTSREYDSGSLSFHLITRLWSTQSNSPTNCEKKNYQC
jgi:hypothetical protein